MCFRAAREGCSRQPAERPKTRKWGEGRGGRGEGSPKVVLPATFTLCVEDLTTRLLIRTNMPFGASALCFPGTRGRSGRTLLPSVADHCSSSRVRCLFEVVFSIVPRRGGSPKAWRDMFLRMILSCPFKPSQTRSGTCSKNTLGLSGSVRLV